MPTRSVEFPRDPALALFGGRPVRRAPWRPNWTTDAREVRAAARVIRGGYLSLFEGSHRPDAPFSFWGGPEVRRLESRWADLYGARYAVSVNSATSGLMAAVGALGLGFGDDVLVSPSTMSACASAVLWYGAIPQFADVDIETGSLDPASVARRVTPRTRAILVVHQFGIPADMDALMAIARRHRLKVIEDCAQAHGALYRGRPVGTIGDIGVFSLNVNKTIQAGEGGVCLTNDRDLRDRLALIRNHGEAVVGDRGTRDITNLVGANFRLTEVTAAMAVEQLRKLPALNRARLEFVDMINEEVARHPFLVAPPRCSHGPAGSRRCRGCRSTYYLYPLRFLEEVAGVGRGAYCRALNAEGMSFYEGYARPLYYQPLYQQRRAFKNGYPFSARENRTPAGSYAPGTCPTAERLYDRWRLMNEHIRPPHTRGDMRDIVRALRKVGSVLQRRRS